MHLTGTNITKSSINHFRILTYLYLAVFNVGLLLSPSHQAYDYQTGSIHLVQSLSDLRNVTTACLVLGLIVAAYRLVQTFVALSNQPQSNSGNLIQTNTRTFSALESSNYAIPSILCSSHALLVSLLFLIMPYMPASNLFLTVGFVVAERLLYIPR